MPCSSAELHRQIFSLPPTTLGYSFTLDPSPLGTAVVMCLSSNIIVVSHQPLPPPRDSLYGNECIGSERCHSIKTPRLTQPPLFHRFPGDADKMLWYKPDQAAGSTWVEEGAPVGQFYGLGGSWTEWRDLHEITKGLGADSPARMVGSSLIVSARRRRRRRPRGREVKEQWPGLAGREFCTRGFRNECS